MSNVQPIRPEVTENDGNAELRRMAVQVAATLPRNLDDALKVLELARRFVVEFMKP